MLSLLLAASLMGVEKDGWYLATVDEQQNARLDAHEVKMDLILSRLDALEGKLRATPDVSPLPPPGYQLPKSPVYEVQEPDRRTVSAPLPSVKSVVVPPNHHAHRTISGEVIVHHDSNHGDPIAHQGIARPWVKVAKAGQIVSVSTSGFVSGGYVSAPSYSRSVVVERTRSVKGCPPGGCPTKRGLFGRIRW